MGWTILLTAPPPHPPAFPLLFQNEKEERRGGGKRRGGDVRRGEWLELTNHWSAKQARGEEGRERIGILHALFKVHGETLLYI